jgi:hypothetical protein
MTASTIQRAAATRAACGGVSKRRILTTFELYIWRPTNSSSPCVGAQRYHQDGDANGDPRCETRRRRWRIDPDRNEQEDDEREDADHERRPRWPCRRLHLASVGPFRSDNKSAPYQRSQFHIVDKSQEFIRVLCLVACNDWGRL